MVEKNKGHKRHILTDTLGNLLAVKVHRANLHDTKAGIFPAIKAFVANVEMRVDISPKIKSIGFQVVPKRWVVERTFAWLAKDFEKTIARGYH